MSDSPGRLSLDATWIRPRVPTSTGQRRIGALVDLRLTCRAGAYDLDVLVRDMERPRGVEIIGQLTCADDLHIPAPDVEVSLVIGDDTCPGPVSPSRAASLEVVHTSAFGEFLFRRRFASVLGIKLGAANDAPTVLVWDRRP